MPDGASASPAGSVAANTAIPLGLTPSLAMDMTYVAMADSVGLAMQNAVANQQRAQVITEAALAQVLTLIITKGTAKS
ncbi:RebB family R body protein [Azospirillum isscasi]|uniref:RebB family R body protein n=1 Tax=Azospirillum isscasi TaxID=3053926 RepID=A0ABU0WPV6_9PROT|nr:RebB family R body protein [Azospirillum isscasi]MDQ2106211.1 RebB family R body protein [Azospirillum isscasi]